ncbi:MAG: LPS export ABC transporter permease LptF [Sphingomonas sp.]|uniref:LPS export ABC transporter permease LptF n=1 Tax=Sphingomonas sp. TaxID=28214 RepID=UPI001AC01CD9|nr:LPS export ABC transporter permease LptF [Sphingomonas sp.]MBN8808378.1 LPS export ABC transporter permease LptF [Sphingomonas sp.]
MKSIDRYMARLIALPLFSTMVIFAMLLVLDRMLRLIDFVVTEGGPVSVVWRMLANLLPEYMGLGIPVGLLLGCLLAFRRLATSSELDVLRAVGVGYNRLLVVPYMYAIVLAVLNLAIVGYIQPKARFEYERLRYELRTGALGASIKVGEFTTFPNNGPTVRIEQSHDEGRQLSGIFLHQNDKQGGSFSVTATQGRFLGSTDADEIIFRLTDGTLVRTEKGIATPRVLRFTLWDIPIPLPRTDPFRGRGENKLERTLPELAVLGRSSNSNEELRDTSRAAFHFRLTEVAAMFLLPMLAMALGVPPKRSTSALGVFLGIVMIVTYFKVNEYGQSVGSLGKIDPFLALWVPFAIFAALVLWMYYTIAYVPGGQPIGALERVFAKLAKAVRRWLPTRRLAPPGDGDAEDANPTPAAGAPA